MTFKYNFSDSLIQILKQINRKDKKLYDSVFKKVEEIVSRDLITIDFYKNLRSDLKEYI